MGCLIPRIAFMSSRACQIRDGLPYPARCLHDFPRLPGTQVYRGPACLLAHTPALASRLLRHGPQPFVPACANVRSTGKQTIQWYGLTCARARACPCIASTVGTPSIRCTWCSFDWISISLRRTRNMKREKPVMYAFLSFRNRSVAREGRIDAQVVTQQRA